VKEVADAKVINSRSYSTISTGRAGSMRTGSKVPYQTGPTSSTPHYEYLDIGVNFDYSTTREVDNQLALTVAAEVSNLAPGQTMLSGLLPLLRQNTWRSDVIVPLRKPTVIFSSDDPTSTHKMQVELTATPIR
jgi:Flp pilus assembly secretin CpaC